ncbi:MAG: hypothetical protein EBW65_04370 [Gammaproteobacteria bacterium]|nr:hypothetical protein [Gammaproteobacteria bacterium]
MPAIAVSGALNANITAFRRGPTRRSPANKKEQKKHFLLFSFPCFVIHYPRMKKQTQAIDVLVNLVDWMMNNNREALVPAFDALKLDADTIFDSFDLAYGDEESDDMKEHLVPLHRVNQELRAMGVDVEE